MISTRSALNWFKINYKFIILILMDDGKNIRVGINSLKIPLPFDPNFRGKERALILKGEKIEFSTFRFVQRSGYPAT